MPVHLEPVEEVSLSVVFVMVVLLRGGRVDVEFGGAVVLEVVADTAVGGAGVQGGRDSGGGADRDVAGLGAQHDRAAHGLGDPDVAPCGADLRGAAQPADLDVAVGRGEADARGLVDLDLVIRAVEDDVAEPPHGPEFGAGRLGLDAGAGGQLDRHLDGSGWADVLVLRRSLDPQDAVGVLDRGLLRRLHVAALGGVHRQDLDRGVGPVGGDEPDASGRDVEDGGDRGGGVELLHRALPALVVSNTENATLHSQIEQLSLCMTRIYSQVIAN
jgi:hypothetical protein